MPQRRYRSPPRHQPGEALHGSDRREGQRGTGVLHRKQRKRRQPDTIPEVSEKPRQPEPRDGARNPSASVTIPA